MPSSSDPGLAIELRGVSKEFRRKRIRGGHTTLKTQLVGWLTGKGGASTFEQVSVLREINLAVPRGATVGVIGQNGSGKSTLLKILTGIYAPNAGVVRIDGRVSALLELGAGFHPEFTGRENIFINGAILGLSRAEIRKSFDEIVAFSELEQHIDQPVRTYSSGMFMRLAFAVATFVNPDILILDEVLSVGDEHFTRKSKEKMNQFKVAGKTILLVTHDLGIVERWCDTAVWLDSGTIAAVGEPMRVVAAYRSKVAERELGATASLPALPEAIPHQAAPAGQGEAEVVPAPPPEAARLPETRWGDKTVTLDRVRLLVDGREDSVIAPEAALTIEISYSAKPKVTDVAFGIGLFRTDGLHIFGTNTAIEGVEVPTPLPPRGTLRISLERVTLNEGNYLLDVAAHAENGVAYDYQKGQYSFAVRSPKHDVGLIRPALRWSFADAEGR